MPRGGGIAACRPLFFSGGRPAARAAADRRRVRRRDCGKGRVAGFGPDGDLLGRGGADHDRVRQLSGADEAGAVRIHGIFHAPGAAGAVLSVHGGAGLRIPAQGAGGRICRRFRAVRFRRRRRCADRPSGDRTVARDRFRPARFLLVLRGDGGDFGAGGGFRQPLDGTGAVEQAFDLAGAAGTGSGRRADLRWFPGLPGA